MSRTVKVSGDEAASTGGYAPLPGGEYIFKIIDITATTVAKSGDNEKTPAINVQFKVVESPDGAHIGSKFTKFRIPDVPKFKSGSTAFSFYQFYKALGVEFPKEGSESEIELPEHEELLGEEIGIRLSKEPPNEWNPDGFNDVKAFFPASKGIKATAVGDKKGSFTL